MAKLQRLPHPSVRAQKNPPFADPRVCVLRPHITDSEGPIVQGLPGCIRPDLRPRDQDWQSDSSSASRQSMKQIQWTFADPCYQAMMRNGLLLHRGKPADAS